MCGGVVRNSEWDVFLLNKYFKHNWMSHCLFSCDNFIVPHFSDITLVERLRENE